MGKRCCTQASLPSKHQALLTRGAKEKGGNSRQGWLQLQHIPQYTPLSTTTLSDCSPCQLSTGKAAGKESLLSCWKQKWKFTLSQASPSGKQRVERKDDGQQTQDSTESANLFSMYVYSCMPTSSFSQWLNSNTWPQELVLGTTAGPQGNTNVLGQPRKMLKDCTQQSCNCKDEKQRARCYTVILEVESTSRIRGWLIHICLRSVSALFGALPAETLELF